MDGLCAAPFPSIVRDLSCPWPGVRSLESAVSAADRGCVFLLLDVGVEYLFSPTGAGALRLLPLILREEVIDDAAVPGTAGVARRVGGGAMRLGCTVDDVGKPWFADSDFEFEFVLEEVISLDSYFRSCRTGTCSRLADVACLLEEEDFP